MVITHGVCRRARGTTRKLAPLHDFSNAARRIAVSIAKLTEILRR
jgi:hypothetical protein